MTKFYIAFGSFALTIFTALPVWADESAKDIYRLHCAQCHGILGTGDGVNQTAGGLVIAPRDHTDAKEMARLSDEQIWLAIAKGGDAVSKSELMPPFGKTLSEKEIQALVLYLRELCQCEGKQ